MMDPAAMQQEAMVALLEQATPVPDAVQRLPDAYDTMPKPYFPADSTRRTRRGGEGL